MMVEKAKNTEIYNLVIEKFPDANLTNVDKIKNED